MLKNIFSNRVNARQQTVWDVLGNLDKLNADRQKAGLDPVINLTLGNPYLAVNKIILESFINKIQQKEILNQFGYSPTAGRRETIFAIQKLYQLYYPKVHFNADNFMCTNGANQAIWNALSVFVNTNDTVLLFEPYFVNYEPQINSLGGNLVKIPTIDNQFRPNARQLDKCLKNYTSAKIIIFNYPNNPSGVVLKKEELKEITQVLKKYPEIIIIIDDAYRELNYADHMTLIDVMPSLKNRSIIINSCSKGLIGAPDMRIGMVAAPQEVIKAMCSQQLLSSASVSFLTQLALVSAIDTKLSGKNDNWEKQAKTLYHKNLELLEKYQHDYFYLANKPAGGFFALLDMSKLLGKKIPNLVNSNMDSGSKDFLSSLHSKLGINVINTDKDIALFVLYVAGVGVVPASKFGIDEKKGLIRISCSSEPKALERAVINMVNACKMFDHSNFRKAI